MFQAKRAVTEFAQVVSCDHCSRQNYPQLLRDDSFNLPQPGYIGSNYGKYRVLLVGQNPGVSPPRFRAQDRELAANLSAVRDGRDAGSMARLKSSLDGTLPTWPVFTSHFPLAECGLQLDDIAYINVVRCRTTDNATPGPNISQACIDNHIIRWLDWLQPRVVVCIGKWAHDRIAPLLKERGIPSTFINRQRSLSEGERRQNRAEAVATVRSILSGDAPKLPKPPGVAPAEETVATGRLVSRRKPIQSPNVGGAGMEAGLYPKLFSELGILDTGGPNSGRLLRHRSRQMPRLYFNRSRDGSVYFVGYEEDRYRFSTRLWDFMRPRKAKDDKPNLITVAPKPGMKKAAFADLMDER